jgi:Fe2+ transport system protein FeoA
MWRNPMFLQRERSHCKVELRMGKARQTTHPSRMPLATQSQLTYLQRTVNELVQKPAVPNPARPLLFPLSDVQAGSSVRIKHVSASPEITSRLREMGFCEDQKIRLISRHTNLICQVCHARIGINSQLAEKILVEPLTGKQAA